MDEDINSENKTLNINSKHNILELKNNFDINEDHNAHDYLYNTDGRINIKTKKQKHLKI